MRFSAIADTDIGICKDTNQDSMLIKHAVYDKTEVLMAIICDGMGGLSKGELASASVIRAFADWFTVNLPFELEKFDAQIVIDKLTLLLKNINAQIMEYGEKNGRNLGTTFSGILLVGDTYIIHHIGDSRIYQINPAFQQLTVDQTFVEREVDQGRLTLEQAKADKRRNLLLQCIGASKALKPQVLQGKINNGVYMICSDGFRHTITESEMQTALEPHKLLNKRLMKSSVRALIDTAKSRGEKDNISVIVIKIIPESEEF